MTELRQGFRKALDEVDAVVTQLFALVSEGLGAATDALLAGDREAGRAIIRKDLLVDELYQRAEWLVQREMLLEGPVAGDFRFLLSVLRIVPELERSGDLVEHIALRAAQGLDAELTPRVRGLIAKMGTVGVEMWRMAADAYAERDPLAHALIDERDDELDELHNSLTAEIASGALSVPVAIEMALVARFYERLGDHAVNVAKRVRFVAGPLGEAPRPMFSPDPSVVPGNPE